MLRPTIDDLILVHKSGVLHRDISPENLLVQDEGIIKLIDFGAATLYSVLSGKRIQSALARQETDQLNFFARTQIPIRWGLRRTLFEGLALDVEKRTQTMEDFRADLYHLPRPIITRKQRIKMLAKALVIYLTATFLVLVAAKMIDEQIPIQMILAAECYIKKDTDNALHLAENYKAGLSGKEGFYRDYSKSMYWYKWAADQGNPEAMFQYALELQLGEIAQKDIESAVTYYEKAAEAGSPMAWNNLGIIYLNGDDIEQNIEKAFMCFQKAEEYEIPLSLYNLGYLYETGQGVDSDIEKAVDYYKRAAAFGNAQGMYRLAICYGTGNGVEQSDLLCLRYLYESAWGQYPEAICEIGHLYETGDFGYTDYNMAFEWYEKACDMDYGGGYYGEALMFRDGIGVDLDEIAASTSMQIAADLKFEPTYKELIKMAENRYGIFEDKDEANQVLSDYEQYR